MSRGGWLDGYGSSGGDSWRDEPREPGARRRKLAGYLKAANELRQTYQQAYMEKWNAHEGNDEDFGSVPGSYPGNRSLATAQNGEEELILFPSYARNHVKQKPKAVPGAIQEAPGIGRDVRDSTGTGDAEYWRQQWDQYEDDNAVVDVDVRGWLYVPHRGPLNRKNRLFVGLARQMVGIPATGASPSPSTSSSRSSSPHGLRQRVDAHSAKHEEEIVAKEAESLMVKGEAEADAAHKGAYSEEPWAEESQSDGLQRRNTRAQLDDGDFNAVQQRPPTWNTPAQMSHAEVVEANKQLMSRLKPFLANPTPYTPISAFFYNENSSRQKTIDTDTYGHFNLRAALDFVPTHVRILTAEGLSATEKVHIVSSGGISIISDIDDTIKHSAITSGAREIFRNVFVRDLRELHIPGVKEWYKRLEDEGVTFHYVSNSPWQLYPLLKSFFAMNGLPKGSFHLKQYSGMLQGIFEPVAERKKGTLERIIRDFPQRRFLLVGDSGEADLEVYTDIVLENPGRVLGVFIRDITSTSKTEFFDSSAPSRQPRSSANPQYSSGYSTTNPPSDVVNGTSRAEPHENGNEQKPKLPPRRITEPVAVEEDLIDLSSDIDEPTPAKTEAAKLQSAPIEKTPPARPLKPRALSSVSATEPKEQNTAPKPAPAIPEKPDKPIPPPINYATKPKTEHQKLQSKPAAPGLRPKERPPVPPKQLSYRSAAREKLSAAYNSLPAASTYLNWSDTSKDNQNPDPVSAKPNATAAFQPAGSESEPSPPPLPSRKPSSYPATPATGPAATTSPNSGSTNGSASDSQQNPGARSAAPTISHPNTFPLSANHADSSYQSSAQPSTVYSRKEELWRRRWARAKGILDSKGVVLRSWHVGEDIADDVVHLVDRALKENRAR